MTRSTSISIQVLEGGRFVRYAGDKVAGEAITTVGPDGIGGAGEDVGMSGSNGELLSSSPDGNNSSSLVGTSWIPEVDSRSVGRKGGTEGGFVEAEALACRSSC